MIYPSDVDVVFIHSIDVVFLGSHRSLESNIDYDTMR